MLRKSNISAAFYMFRLRERLIEFVRIIKNYNEIFQSQLVASTYPSLNLSDYVQNTSPAVYYNYQADAKQINNEFLSIFPFDGTKNTLPIIENICYSTQLYNRRLLECFSNNSYQPNILNRSNYKPITGIRTFMSGESAYNKKFLTKNKSVSGAGNKRQRYDTKQNLQEDHPLLQQPPLKKPLLQNGNQKSSSKLQSKQFEALSSQIWQKFLDEKQDDKLYCRKMKLWNQLSNQLKETFPYCGLYVVGSSMTGLGSSSSDVDMCLMLSHEEIDQKTDATKILNFITRLIRSKFIKNPVVIRAKVPILNFSDAQSGCTVDLNINNAVGIRNTQLLKCYADCDWRVRPLVLIIKSWAQIQGINDARANTLSSYSIVLMVINFLQCGIEPNVLPCLQKLYPNKFVPDSDVRILSLNEQLPVIPSTNKMSLGELLLNFFYYYAHSFKYNRDTVSIRLGCIIPTYLSKHQPSTKNTPAQWNLVCIEEPFDYTNTARSVYDKKAFKKIVKAFQNTYQNMKKDKSLDSTLATSS